jgi:hypothetical protein
MYIPVDNNLLLGILLNVAVQLLMFFFFIKFIKFLLTLAKVARSAVP